MCLVLLCCCLSNAYNRLIAHSLYKLYEPSLPWFLDFGVGESDADRLRRDINVPVKRPLEAREAHDRVARKDPPCLTARSEEARIMSLIEPKWPLEKRTSICFAQAQENALSSCPHEILCCKAFAHCAKSATQCLAVRAYNLNQMCKPPKNGHSTNCRVQY